MDFCPQCGGQPHGNPPICGNNLCPRFGEPIRAEESSAVGAEGPNCSPPSALSHTRSFLASGIGLHVIAAIHVVPAIGLVVAIVGLWNLEDPVGSLVEALFWVCLTIALLAMAWGLWIHIFV